MDETAKINKAMLEYFIGLIMKFIGFVICLETINSDYSMDTRLWRYALSLILVILGDIAENRSLE